jgi:hypothetical protein
MLGPVKRFTRAIGLSVSVLGLAWPVIATAATLGDAEATQLLHSAMEDDYLATKFDRCESKLRQAAHTCKRRGCSPSVEAEVHSDLAVIEGLVRNDSDKAADELRQMLRIDPTRQLDKQYANDIMKAAFDVAHADVEKELAERRQNASEEAKRANDAEKVELDRRMHVPPPLGKLDEKPWPEQAATYPVPVFVRLPPPPPDVEPERVAIARVTVDYVGSDGAPGEVELKPTQNGYGGTVPCSAVQTPGTLTYFTTAWNRFSIPVAVGGSADDPHKVTLKVAISSTLPHLPGDLPPRSCKDDGKQPECKLASDCGWAKECSRGVCIEAVTRKKLPPVAPKSRGCAGCVAAPSEGAKVPALLAALYVAAAVVRKRARVRGGARANAL